MKIEFKNKYILDNILLNIKKIMKIKYIATIEFTDNSGKLIKDNIPISINYFKKLKMNEIQLYFYFENIICNSIANYHNVILTCVRDENGYYSYTNNFVILSISKL
jgi:hypothetical protein